MDTLIDKDKSQTITLRLKKYKYNESHDNNNLHSDFDYDINLENSDKMFLGNEVFSFFEYDKVELTFIGKSPDDFMKIESYLDDEDSENKQTMKMLKSGDTILVSPGGDDDNMLVPGHYEINLNVDKKDYYGFYFVKPSTATWDSITNMRNYIEDRVKGISYNVSSKRKSSIDTVEGLNHTLIDKYIYLDEVQNMLIGTLGSVIKNPITIIEKVYKNSHKSKRPTKKSQRWMNQKGHKYNSDIFNPNVFYEKTSVESKDILENRVLKSMLNEIIQIIVNLLLELKIEDINNDKKIHKINKRKDSLRERIDKINSEKTVSKSLENSIQRDLKIITREKKEYISIKKDIEKYIHNLNRIKNSLRFYIKESWLFDIESSKECLVTSKLTKNKYYSEIYRIYMYLKEGRTEGQQNISFAYKKTSKLFEIYTFLLLKDIFENFGFEWTDGWLRNANKLLSFNSDLNRGDYIILEHLDYKVKITYDSMIKKSRELSSSKSPISQISSKQYQRNIRPDILIELYKDNQFLEAIVVEVKYRKMKYIHSDIENTKVDEQLESYRDFEYYDADIKGVRRMLPINKVIAVYPQQNGAKKMVNPTYQNIMFIPISIKDEDSYSGYEGFRDEILEVIKPYIKEEDFNSIYDLEALDIKI